MRKFKKQYKDFIRNSSLFIPSNKLKPFKNYEKIINRFEIFLTEFTCAQSESVKRFTTKKTNESLNESTGDIVDDTLNGATDETIISISNRRSNRNRNTFYVGDTQIASQDPTQINTQVCEDVQSSLVALNLSETQVEKKPSGKSKYHDIKKQESSIRNEQLIIPDTQIETQPIRVTTVPNERKKSRKKFATEDEESIFKTPSYRSESSGKRPKKDTYEQNDSKLSFSVPCNTQNLQSTAYYSEESLKLSDFSIPYTIRFYNKNEIEKVDKLPKDYLIKMKEDTSWFNNF